jgi:hypothetical protein
VRLPRTAEFDAEREVYSLRFCCEDCGHFDASDGGCRHEWPNESHRRQVGADGRSPLDFCKEFELC